MKGAICLLILLWAGLLGCAPNHGPPLFRDDRPAPALTAPIASATPLPSSMKGYELYSWRQDSGEGWRHTLITGTNRLKSYKEIVSGEDKVAESGWVKVTAVGTEELKAQLKRLPAGSIVFWQGGDRLLGVPTAATVMLPEFTVVEEIQRYTGQLEIQLHLETQSSISSPGTGE